VEVITLCPVTGVALMITTVNAETAHRAGGVQNGAVEEGASIDVFSEMSVF
jgi:hypothetical protein